MSAIQSGGADVQGKQMRILLYSPTFYPRVGGLEGMVAMLAEGLALRGHDVRVITTTIGNGAEPFEFPVIRQPKSLQLLQLVRWTDVFFQANVSLKGLWPLLLVRKPYVVAHHSWYRRPDGQIGWRETIKRKLLRLGVNIAASRALAEDNGVPAIVIPNCYADDVFVLMPEIERSRDLAFVGRLVSDKGVIDLLVALVRLRGQGLRPSLTIVGKGPEEDPLRAFVAEHGLNSQVRFVGVVEGHSLAALLNGHRILVVPSRYNEPFGIVALEGIACGCVVVGTAGGGLPEAIGPCGMTVPNGDPAGLADAIKELLENEKFMKRMLEQVEAHLAKHRRERVVTQYLSVLEATARRTGG